MIAIILAGCTATTTAPASSTATVPPLPPPETATVTSPPATLTPSPTAGEPPVFWLAEPGPYFPGKINTTIPKEKTRGGSQLGITLWYPAVKPEGYGGTLAQDAAVDTQGAPYPLLLTVTIFGNEVAAHLASYGFVVAGVDGQGPSERFGAWVLDYPLEILSMLDYLASTPPPALEGAIAADNSGVLGYSFSGHNSLVLSGARLDPEYYLAKCAQGPELGASPSENVVIEQTHRYFCEMAAGWDDFVSHAGQAITTSGDGLWQPLSDGRIRAAMPMAPDGAWLFGERGLAAVQLPVLMICGTADSRDTDYRASCVYTFEQLGSPEKGLISFIDQDHMMVFDKEPKRRIKHFITAFFGYHLQGSETYQEAYSQEFVSQYDDLAWGVYTAP